MFAATKIQSLKTKSHAIHPAGPPLDNQPPSQPNSISEIIRQKKLDALFQPILNLKSGEFYGYEGLIRGPIDSNLHSPINLFDAAARENLSLQLEMLCRQIMLEQFVQLDLPGMLFLNVSPDALLHPSFRNGCTLEFIEKAGFSADRVVIEITENQPTFDFSGMRKALLHYRNMGFKIAIDDLGEGFSSLRLWSELRPEFIKIDKHFVHGVDTDPIKLQFLKSIQLIAESCGTHVIAEGIETEAEISLIKEIDITFGQGYLIAHPSTKPPATLPETITTIIRESKKSGGQPPSHAPKGKPITQKLLRNIEPVHPATTNSQILERFTADPKLRAIPVVKDEKPLGLISRYAFIDWFVKPYQRELTGNKPCINTLQEPPLLVDKNMPIEELGHFMAAADERHFNNGFIVTDHGKYLGVATGQDVLRELTRMQIEAARHSNPLTMLPGNVPINAQIEYLLAEHAPFHICYCDLDHFKPYNDTYGYHNGDEMIQLTGRILSWACDPQLDFIGHIGGDDFILLMRSRDVVQRCEKALRTFEQASALLFKPEHLQAGGYATEDRNYEVKFHPLTSLSIGMVAIAPGEYSSHHEVSAAAAAAKQMAKRTHGSSLFIEKRKK